MEKASKLLRKSEIEYLTPFLKLWLAFNRWYKQHFRYNSNINTDAKAIKECKETNNNLKSYFIEFFKNNSEEGKLFREAIELLFIKSYDYNLKDNQENLIFELNPLNEEEKKIFLIPYDSLGKENRANFTQVHKNIFISSNTEEELFKKTLDLIYGVRCKLIHGDFDIENETFLKLVESSYKILFPLTEKILGVN